MKVFTYMNTSIAPNHRNSSPHQPLLLEVWMEISMNFHRLETICMAFDNIWAWHTPLIYHMWKKTGIQKVKADQLTQYKGQGWACHTPLISIYGRKWTMGRSWFISWPSLHVCPIPSVWSQIRGWKHIKFVLNFFAMYILQNSFKIKWEKHLESSWNSVFFGHRQTILHFVKIGYYPSLSLAVLAFKFIHCLLLLINY